MTYNLLSVNNITKICDTKIYTFNNNILPIQWLNFQLKWLVEKLKLYPKQTSYFHQQIKTYYTIPYFLDLTNSELYNILKKQFGLKKVTIISSLNTPVVCNMVKIPDEIFINIKEESKKFGFYQPDNKHIIKQNIKDESYFGGFSNFTADLSHNKAFIICKKIDEDNDWYLDKKPDIYNDKFPFVKGIENLDMFNLEQKQININDDVDDVVDEAENNLTIATKWIQDNMSQECLTGFFRFSKNSCYADSIIFLIIHSIISRKKGLLYDIIAKKKIITVTILIQ